MNDYGTGSFVPGWSTGAFDPHYAASAKTASSHLRAEIPDTYDGIKLTHVGHEMLAYWHGARGHKTMPESSDISPAGFRELLPYSRYLSWEGGNELLIRVFGSALCTALGLDLTGYNLLDTFTPEQRDSEIARLRLLHDHPCGMVLIRRSFIAGGGMRNIEILHLPVGPAAPEPGAKGQQRILGSVMVRHIPDRWDGETDRTRPMELLATACIDIGFGAPAPEIFCDSID